MSNDLTQLLREMTPGDRRLGKAVKQPPTPWRHLEKAPSSDWASMELEDVPLYTFSGLRAEPRNEDVLQDFRIDRRPDANPNPVSYLWADVYRGNSITASVEEADPPHLSVTFENKPTSWACNVAIRPIEERAVTTRGQADTSIRNPISNGILSRCQCASRDLVSRFALSMDGVSIGHTGWTVAIIYSRSQKPGKR